MHTNHLETISLKTVPISTVKGWCDPQDKNDNWKHNIHDYFCKQMKFRYLIDHV
jgi:hypothetical protein